MGAFARFFLPSMGTLTGFARGSAGGRWALAWRCAVAAANCCDMLATFCVSAATAAVKLAMFSDVLATNYLFSRRRMTVMVRLSSGNLCSHSRR